MTQRNSRAIARNNGAARRKTTFNFNTLPDFWGGVIVGGLAVWVIAELIWALGVSL